MEAVILAAVRHGAETDAEPLHARQPVGHQTAADQQPPGPEGPPTGRHPDLAVGFLDAGDLVAGPDVGITPADFPQHGLADGGEIRDGRFAYEDGAQAADARFGGR